MRRLLLACVCVGLVAPACARTGNDERAYYAQDGSSYRVELKGRRRQLAHDPLSFVRGRTYEATLILQLPRIEGVIEASEIPVASGKLPYGGRIVITRSRMHVELHYDNRSDTTKVPLDWNGDYVLMQKGARPAR